jgi:aerobic-type carbon monoxide dehydrogenase small subunit (CoxS/CutS family)
MTDSVNYIVNCRECHFYSVEPDMRNADIVRDYHEMDMFNLGEEQESCGPCAIAPMRSEKADVDYPEV